MVGVAPGGFRRGIGSSIDFICSPRIVYGGLSTGIEQGCFINVVSAYIVKIIRKNFTISQFETNAHIFIKRIANSNTEGNTNVGELITGCTWNESLALGTQRL